MRGAVDAVATPASEPMAPRKYVLLVSGTMNPPHRGHVRLGLHAAEQLQQQGHTVTAIAYCPVHDNYLYNKLALKASESNAVSGATLCFPMARRSEMLRSLLKLEDSPLTKLCHVVEFEHSIGSAALECSSYWQRLLPNGYLRTLPTASLVRNFADTSPLLAAHSELAPKGKARVAVVLGIDNLASLPTWQSPEKVLERSDLVIVARAMGSVDFAADPSALLSTLRHLHVRTRVPVRRARAADETEAKVLFGETLGSTERSGAGEGALFLLPPLEGGDEHLSSTALRNGTAAFLSVLAAHGFRDSGAAALMLRDAADGGNSKHRILQAAAARCELVGDSAAKGAPEPTADACVREPNKSSRQCSGGGGRVLRAWQVLRRGVFACAQPQTSNHARSTI